MGINFFLKVHSLNKSKNYPIQKRSFFFSTIVFPSIIFVGHLRLCFFFFFSSPKKERKGSHSVMSESLRPHGLQPTRLPSPWDFPGESSGVGCHFLLHTLTFIQCDPSNSIFKLPLPNSQELKNLFGFHEFSIITVRRIQSKNR